MINRKKQSLNGDETLPLNNGKAVFRTVLLDHGSLRTATGISVLAAESIRKLSPSVFHYSLD